MLRARPCHQIGSAFRYQLQRQGWSDAVDLGQIHTKDAVQGGPDIECRRAYRILAKARLRQWHWAAGGAT